MIDRQHTIKALEVANCSNFLFLIHIVLIATICSLGPSSSVLISGWSYNSQMKHINVVSWKKTFSSQSKSKEDIKWRHKDINFIFEWWKQYFMNEQSEWVKYCFHHEKIKFMSSATHRVMFFLLYGNNTINVQFGLSHMIDIFTIVKWYKKYLTVYIFLSKLLTSI